MTSLEQYLSVRGRFARSVRLDRDAGRAAQLDGYVPTGRSLEVIRRLVHAMQQPDGTRAFSITGPYGSGKSSLALFIDALLGPVDEDSHRAALTLLDEYDPGTAKQLTDARRGLNAGSSGFIPAVITAPQREPITATVLRALHTGAARAGVAKSLRDRIGRALERTESARYAAPSYQEIRELLEELSERRPVLLVLDEFGKNLESYAESGREGDLYLLQELAEWSSGADSLPLVLVTIQHLAFEAYASDASTAQRREWAKVQGRFEDVPFVDSAAATRSLIATALVHADDPEYTKLREQSGRAAADAAEHHGLATVAEPDLLAACFPLHPSTLLVLPELCARFGQNERSLFSFLASQEPYSLLSFARDVDIADGPSWVRLDQVYDYFVQSASAFVGASPDASRWIEVDSIIRDAHGLTDGQLRVLKTVGVLNLVAAGGSLRASHELLAFAAADGQPGTRTEDEVAARLRELAQAGFIVYRDFASEYRVWRGSDFDIAAALTSARHQVRQRSLAGLLDEIQPMRPFVAARHTIETGTTRAFARTYLDRNSRLPDLDRRGDKAAGPETERLHGCDGLLAYVVGTADDVPSLELPDNGLPVVTVTPADPQPLTEAAVEVGALLEVAKDPTLPAEDRVAHRELVERTAHARQVLDRAIAETFADEAIWTWHNPRNKDGRPPKQPRPQPFTAGRGSHDLSDVFDRVFANSPPVFYEAINRTALTSQGAKARRELLGAILTPTRQRQEQLGLTGEGADVAMYRALLQDSGIHDPDEGLGPPTDTRWKPVWQALTSALTAANDAPISVEHLLACLSDPPYGLKNGTATVLLVVGLVEHASEIAVYEHGTFRPRLDAPLAERLVRNPGNFAVKHLAASRGSKRQQTVHALASRLSERLPDHASAQAATARPTVLTVTFALVDLIQRRADEFTRKTRRFQLLWDPSMSTESVERARGIRDALLQAHEPDALLFQELPQAVGYPSLPASGKGNDALTKTAIDHFATEVADAVAIVASAHDHLADHITHTICAAANRKTLEEVVSLAPDVGQSEVLTPQVQRFTQLARMFEAYTDLSAWLGAVTEAVCGRSLRYWSDPNLQGYLHHLRHTVADYARVADLARFINAGTTETFQAYKLSVTRQDGAGNREGDVVTVPSDKLHPVRETLEAVSASLAELFDGNQQAARRAMLGVLVDDLTVDDNPAETRDSSQFPREEDHLANE